jgi:AraC-like DNA-binding protein
MKLEGLHEKDIFTERYPFRLVENTNELQYPMHWHNAVELAYNAAGTCCISVSGTEYPLAEGDLLLIPTGEIHEITVSSKNGKQYFIQFNISTLDGFGGINDIRPFMERTVRICRSEEPGLQNSIEMCILQLIREHENKDYAYALSINARIFDIIVLISRNHLRSFLGGNISSSKKIAGLQQINKAFEYIENNFPLPVTLKDASRAAGFSEYYFSRLFKEYTGQSFVNYLNTYRIKHAEKLLKSTEMPVLDIAMESGFNSLPTFNRIFKRVKGCSPTFYRKAGK